MGAHLLNRQAGAVPDHGIPAVGAHHQVRTDFHWTGGGVPPNANDPALLFDQPGDVRLHSQMEGGIAAPLLGEEIQEIHCGIIATKRRRVRRYDISPITISSSPIRARARETR
jgi:hypothetical protein